MNLTRHEAGSKKAGVNIGGQFAKSAQTEAAGAGLFTEIEPDERVMARIELQRWSGDNAEAVDVLEVDLSELFQDVALEDIPEEIDPNNGDAYFSEAQGLGIVPIHDGPFDVWIDSDQFAAYRDRRERLGLIDHDSPSPALIAERQERLDAQMAELDALVEDLQAKREQYVARRVALGVAPADVVVPPNVAESFTTVGGVEAYTVNQMVHEISAKYTGPWIEHITDAGWVSGHDGEWYRTEDLGGRPVPYLPVSVKSLSEHDERGTLWEYSTTLMDRYDQVIYDNIDLLNDHVELKMPAIDNRDFLLRVRDDGLVKTAEFQTGEDDRAIHYLNSVIELVNAPDREAQQKILTRSL